MKTRMLPALCASAVLTVAVLGCGGSDQTVSMVGGAGDLNSQLLAYYSNVSAVLESVTDEGSAQAALPKLEAANANLAKLADAAESASPEAKAELNRLAASHREQLKALTDQVCADPGVKAVIQPSMDSILATLAAF